MIINQDNKIFVAKRIDTKSETWQMPQGGIDEGEVPIEAAIREMAEEIGTSNGTVLTESKYWYSYDVPKFLISKLWDGKYKGQKQKWFLIRFKGTDQDINIDTIHAEFSAWKWVDIKDLLDIVISFKRDLYKSVIKEFDETLKKEKVIL